MTRKLGDIGGSGGQYQWPPVGKHHCVCVGSSRHVAKTGAAGVRLTWRTLDGDCRFVDDVWIGTNTLRRLKLVAMRVCDFGADIELEDDDTQAAEQIGSMIQETAVDCEAIVEVVEELDRDGKRRKKVAYSGYERVERPESVPADPQPTEPKAADDSLPF